jgi:hypothetical protein
LHIYTDFIFIFLHIKLLTLHSRVEVQGLLRNLNHDDNFTSHHVNSETSAFYQHNIFMYFVLSSKQAWTIFLNNIEQLVFVMETS